MSVFYDDGQAGTWADVLPFCLNVTILDNFSGKQSEGDRFAPPVLNSFHDNPSSQKGLNNNGS